MSVADAAREVSDVLARRDYARLRELLTDDFVDHSAPPDAPGGPVGYVATMTWVTEKLGIAYQVQDVVDGGDRVAVRALATGVDAGGQFGRPATGRSFAMETMHVYAGRDGKLAEHWGVLDQLGMLRQVGAFPG